MLSFGATLLFGFFLGMRHATDPDHVVAVSTIVARERTVWAAAPVGVLWGLGHTLTILVVGGAIIAFDLIVPPRLGLSMEFSVAVMLVLLGTLNVRNVVSEARAATTRHDPHDASGLQAERSIAGGRGRGVRPLFIGVVHGLAGSAAVALLVLSAIHDPWWGIGYLFVFGAGTVAGMLLITVAMAMPMVAAARRFTRLHRTLAMATGIASMGFGAFLTYQIAIVDGLFTSTPQWDPH